MLGMFNKKEVSKEYIFSIDIETSGSNMEKNGLLSIGATVVDSDLNELDKFYVNIKLPEGREFEKICWDQFWSKNPQALAAVQKDAISPEEAMQQFSTFLNKIENTNKSLAIVTDNPCYDPAWINLYLAKYTDRYPLYYTQEGRMRTIVDVYTMMKNLCGIIGHGDLQKTKDMAQALGFVRKEEWQHNHHSLSDARYIASNYWQAQNKIRELSQVMQSSCQPAVSLNK